MKALKRKEFIDHGSTLSPQILNPPHLALSSLDPQTRSSFLVPLHLEGHIKFPNKSKKKEAIVIVLVIIIVIVNAIVIAQLGTALLISVRPTSWWVMLLRVWGRLLLEWWLFCPDNRDRRYNSGNLFGFCGIERAEGNPACLRDSSIPRLDFKSPFRADGFTPLWFWRFLGSLAPLIILI